MRGWIRAYSDIFIKYLFGSPDSTDLLLSFLNSLQSAHDFPLLSSVEVQNPFNLQTALADKLSILDIRAQDQDGRLYNIEIQATAQAEYSKRSLYYWAKVYAGQLSEAEGYGALHPVIGVHILNFILFPELEAVENCFVVKHTDNPDVVLTDHLSLHYIEIPKLPEGHFDSQLEQWVAYLKNEGKEGYDMTILLKDNPTMAKAHRRYEAFTRDDQARMAYESRIAFQRDQISREQAAEKEGELKGKLDTARNLKILGISPQQIAQATGLSLEDIDRL